MTEPAPAPPITNVEDPRARARFALAGTALFAAVVCAGLWRHELWRDEAKAWLIARDSTSLLDALHNRRYEGHPIVWYAMLHIASRVTRDPIAMQLVHAVTAAAGAFVFLRFAPFRRWARGLFVAGIFPLYTYATISRNYAAGLLVLFAMLALFASARRRPVWAATLAAVLASCSIYGLFLAGASAVAWIVREVAEPTAAGAGAGARGRRVLALAITLAGLAFGAAQVIPPAPTAAPDRARLAAFADFSERGVGAVEALSRVWSPILPLPPADRVVNVLPIARSTWPSFTGGGFQSARAAAAVALLALLVYALRRVPASVAFLLVAVGATVAFHATLFNASARHEGHVYVAIVAASWMWRSTTRRPLATPAYAAMLAVFGLHAFVGAGYVAADLIRPYSSSRATAQLLAARYGREFDLIFEPADYGSSVAGYLDVPIYFPTHRRWATYELRDGTPKIATPDELRDAILLVLGRARRPVVLVIDGPRPDVPGVSFELLAARQTSISHEAWDVYQVRRADAAPASTSRPGDR